MIRWLLQVLLADHQEIVSLLTMVGFPRLAEERGGLGIITFAFDNLTVRPLSPRTFYETLKSTARRAPCAPCRAARSAERKRVQVCAYTMTVQ